MSVNPKTISTGSLAYEALQIMENNNISQIIIMDKSKYIGIVNT